jgi:hypothetical protein
MGTDKTIHVIRVIRKRKMNNEEHDSNHYPPHSNRAGPLHFFPLNLRHQVRSRNLIRVLGPNYCNQR